MLQPATRVLVGERENTDVTWMRVRYSQTTTEIRLMELVRGVSYRIAYVPSHSVSWQHWFNHIYLEVYKSKHIYFS
jgi:hypothetical protein